MIENWQAVTAVAASVVVAGGGAIAVVRHLLKADFVPRGVHSALEKRVDGLEKRVVTMPSEHDLTDLTRRLGTVETNVAVVRTTADGINAGMKRVERTVDQMLQHLLTKGEA